MNSKVISPRLKLVMMIKIKKLVKQTQIQKTNMNRISNKKIKLKKEQIKT